MENETKKRTLIYVIIAMVLGALVGTFAATLVYKQQSVAVNIDNGTSDAKLNAIWDLVERKYVDRIDADSVMDKVYETMLTTLDPPQRLPFGQEAGIGKRGHPRQLRRRGHPDIETSLLKSFSALPRGPSPPPRPGPRKEEKRGLNN